MKEKNVYLELEMSTGKMYQYSKTEQEGYVKVVNTNPQRKKEAVSYRKYYDQGIVGALKGLTIRDTDFGKKISIALWHDVDDKMYYMSLPLFDGKKSVSSFATSVIRYSPFLELNDVYRFFPYVLEKEYQGKVTKNYGVSVKWSRTLDNAVDDINKIQMLTQETSKVLEDGTREVTPGDVPMKEWEEGITGTPEVNTKKRDKFLWDTLNANIKAFEGGGTQKITFNSKETSETPTQEPVQKAAVKEEGKALKPSKDFETKPAVVEAVDEDEDDDESLPF
jgi:hypothetical protein